MKYRQLKTDFWEDGYILDLDNEEKLLFIYLFTNDKVNMSGIYELPDRIICSTLGLTLEKLSLLKTKFEKDNKYAFYKNWVFIVNFAEHNEYSSAPNILHSFIRDFNAVPTEIATHFFSTLKLNYIPPIKNHSKVMVKVMVMDKKGTPYPRIEAKGIDRGDEYIDPKEIPF